MKTKHLLAGGALALAAVLPMQAQQKAPIMEFHTLLYEMNGGTNLFSFSLGATSDTYVEIDFGYGPDEYEVGYADFDPESQSIKGTRISGSVSSEGIVKIYGDPKMIDYLDLEGVYADRLDISQLTNLDILNLAHNELLELDLSPLKYITYLDIKDNPFTNKPFVLGNDHPELQYLDISQLGALDQSLDLTDFKKLQQFVAFHTFDLRVCDPTNCPNLLRLTIDCTNVETLDVTKNPNLVILNIGETRIKEIDLSSNLKLQQFYCTHSGVFNREYKLDSIDLTNLTNLVYLFASGNNFTQIDLSDCPKLFHLSLYDNKLTSLDFSGNPELYSIDIKNNNMDFVTLPAPKDTYFEYYYRQNALQVDKSYPVGAILDLASRLERPGSVTTAALLSKGEALGEEYYSYKNGVIEFYKSVPDSVCLSFGNTTFPEYGLYTTNFMIKDVEDFGKDNAVITWRPKPATRNLAISVGIAGATPENPKRFSVDLGDGNPVDYTTTTNLMPEEAIVVTEKKGNGNMTVYVPEGETLTAFSLTDAPLSRIDLTAAHGLCYLDLTNCALADIDMTWNRCLKYITLDDNALESLNLKGVDDTYVKTTLYSVSANNNNIKKYTGPELGNARYMSLANNQLAEYSLNGNKVLEYLDLSGNQITDINLQDGEALQTFKIANNNLSSLQINDYVPLKHLDISNNRFPLSTLPETGVCETYIYAPQKQWQLPEKAPAVDLSSQVITLGGKETQFKWYKESDNTELTSSQVTGKNGRFRFLDTSIGNVYATWTHPSFPDFAGENVYKSTPVEAADAPTHVAASFTTSGAGQFELIARSAVPNNYIYVDWAGDGNMEGYELDHNTFKVFPVECYKDADVKIYTYDDRDAISVLTLDKIPMSKADFSKLTDVFSLGLSYNGLKGKDIKLPESDLTSLRLSGNDITGLDLVKYKNLESLTLQECGLTEFDASPFKKILNLVIMQNPLKKLTLDNPELWNFYAEDCGLESIDLSKVPAMQQLYLDINNLKEIDVTKMPKLKVLTLTGNKFSFTTLPRILSTYNIYQYTNQALFDPTIVNAETIDLSSQLMVGTNKTVYRWFRDSNVGVLEDGSVVGDELVEGTDFHNEDGVFKFDVYVHNAVCVMTNAAFPGMYLVTVPVPEIFGSAVESVAASTLRVKASNGEVIVTGAEGKVSLYAADGRLAGLADAAAGEVRFSGLTKGVYIVTAGAENIKVMVK